jgi:prepilin-type processing-associated H-X9-DG protein
MRWSGPSTEVKHPFIWIMVVIVGGVCFLYYAHCQRYRTVDLARRVVCGARLRELGIAVTVYAADFNDSLPAGDRWCDLLVERESVVPDHFVCRVSHAVRGQSSYAMNAKVIGWKRTKLPADVVLLFESKPGWNQVGGPELLSTENHKEEGCSVLFGDGHVEFVERKQLARLKWKPD